MALRYITDEMLTTALGPDFDLDQAQEILGDAGRVYQYIRSNEWITEAKLRSYGERNGIDPDRMTTVLDFLQGAGRLHAANLTAAAVEGLPEDAE